MSNIWISAKTAYVPGVQAKTYTESQQAQSTPAVTTLDYSLHANLQSVTESQKAQSTPAITALNYA